MDAGGRLRECGRLFPQDSGIYVGRRLQPRYHGKHRKVSASQQLLTWLQQLRREREPMRSWLNSIPAKGLVVLGLLATFLSGCDRPTVAVQTLEGPFVPAKDPKEIAGPALPSPLARTGAEIEEGDPPMEGTTPVAAPPKVIQSKPSENHPFPKRLEVPEFPRGLEWLNTGGPLKLRTDLKGKFVLLDFWTYCCINCMHILPELKKAEKAFPNNLVVIGVHSAKFDTEKDTANIKEAILRYEIEHPVINDADHRVWRTYGIEAWPSLLLIDPEGNAIWFHSSELTFADLEPILRKGIDY